MDRYRQEGGDGGLQDWNDKVVRGSVAVRPLASSSVMREERLGQVSADSKTRLRNLTAEGGKVASAIDPSGAQGILTFLQRLSECADLAREDTASLGLPARLGKFRVGLRGNKIIGGEEKVRRWTWGRGSSVTLLAWDTTAR